MDDVEKLKAELEAKSKEIELLKERLKKVNETSVQSSLPAVVSDQEALLVNVKSATGTLAKEEIERYGRQMILPEIGLPGQLKLRNASVIVVGCGGLGCPCAIYLAAAGIGHVGLVDYDVVELGNLHRQILHTESKVNEHKSASVAHSCNQLNSNISCTPYNLALNSRNALEIIEKYDIVVDATDNVATRYLLNDACVLAGKPLVSGSALRFEGQLTVYNYEGGPCYRCLYPTPPPPETVTNCSDGGVLGAVPGLIGCLQAIEVIKIAALMTNTYSQRLLLFDALYGSFKTIKLRPKQKTCSVCGENPTITKLIDYEQFCGSSATDKTKAISVLTEENRISVKEYNERVQQGEPHVLVDVRPEVQVEMCCLPNTTNIPIEEIDKDRSVGKLLDRVDKVKNSGEGTLPVYVICRQGNDSQLATVKLQKKLAEHGVTVKDIKGGLKAWSKQIDSSFPDY